MKAHRAEFPIRVMCRVLGLSPSGYYAWLKRPPSAHARRDAELRVKIRERWEGSRRTYGRPRIHADLKAGGERVGAKRVARLMREEGIKGVSRRRRPKTTQRDKGGRTVPDLVQRNFSASGPDKLWVADITYVRTARGWLYLSVVMDAWSRKITGWAMETHLRTELECELLQRRAFRDPGHAKQEVFEFIEGFYNPRRRHSAIGCESPVSFEQKHATAPRHAA